MALIESADSTNLNLLNHTFGCPNLTSLTGKIVGIGAFHRGWWVLVLSSGDPLYDIRHVPRPGLRYQPTSHNTASLGSLSTNDIDGFADRIRELWNQPKRCVEMGRNARADYEKKYQPTDNYRQLIAIYQDLV